MTLIAAALAVLAVLVWRGRRTRAAASRWRAPAAIAGLGLVFAGVLEALRGGAAPGVGLTLAGVLLLAAARWTGRPVRRQGPELSLVEARALLGVGEGATADEVRTAHARLIRMAHPDAGGTSGLAAQVNAARDRLLRDASP